MQPMALWVNINCLPGLHVNICLSWYYCCYWDNQLHATNDQSVHTDFVRAVEVVAAAESRMATAMQQVEVMVPNGSPSRALWDQIKQLAAMALELEQARAATGLPAGALDKMFAASCEPLVCAAWWCILCADPCHSLCSCPPWHAAH
jgi:hypothetical protein